jgi:hypothetical protein
MTIPLEQIASTIGARKPDDSSRERGHRDQDECADRRCADYASRPLLPHTRIIAYRGPANR